MTGNQPTIEKKSNQNFKADWKFLLKFPIMSRETGSCNMTQENHIMDHINVTYQYDIAGNIFSEPFTELWKKLFGTVSYTLTAIGGLIILAFVGYESHGFAFHYRTALNQLNSWLLTFVSKPQSNKAIFRCKNQWDIPMKKFHPYKMKEQM